MKLARYAKLDCFPFQKYMFCGLEMVFPMFSNTTFAHYTCWNHPDTRACAVITMGHISAGVGFLVISLFCGMVFIGDKTCWSDLLAIRWTSDEPANSGTGNLNYKQITVLIWFLLQRQRIEVAHVVCANVIITAAYCFSRTWLNKKFNNYKTKSC